ncbi:hypothetical protein [Streptomyces coryli]|nr:hypothetical protein [Streptomyces coryli]
MTASAVSLVVLVAACGGTEQSGGGDSEGKAKPVVKALSAAELGKVVLGPGDIDGHKVEQPKKGDAYEAGDVSADKADCEPLAQAFSGVPVGAPARSEQRVVSEEIDKDKQEMPSVEELAEMSEEEVQEATFATMDATKTMLSVSSYDGAGAEKTVAALRTAAKKCAGGFTVTADGEKQRVTKIVADQVAGGDENLAWTVTATSDGTSAETKVSVVRKGGTLAGFASWNIAAVGAGKKYDQPTEVIDAQAAKLR